MLRLTMAVRVRSHSHYLDPGQGQVEVDRLVLHEVTRGLEGKASTTSAVRLYQGFSKCKIFLKRLLCKFVFKELALFIKKKSKAKGRGACYISKKKGWKLNSICSLKHRK